MCAKGGCSVVKGPVTEENVSDLQVHKITHPSLIHPCVDIKALLEIVLDVAGSLTIHQPLTQHQPMK